jgi:hypothetical protein
MYSLPARFTPSRRIVVPFPSTKWLPEIEIDGDEPRADVTCVAREVETVDTTRLNATRAKSRM